MKIVLDTNAYTAFVKGNQAAVGAVAKADTVMLTTTILGELYFGFTNGSRSEANQAILTDFLGDPAVTVVPVSLQIAKHYGTIATKLRKAGTPIPTNDIWIAAACIEHNATLVTADTDFSHVKGLKISPL